MAYKRFRKWISLYIEGVHYRTVSASYCIASAFWFMGIFIFLYLILEHIMAELDTLDES